MKYDVAIIGGGLSGLSAAVELANRGAKVILVEQSSKLGGRCYSYQDKTTGDIVDNGQHILHGSYVNTLKYLENIGSRKFIIGKERLILPLFHKEKGICNFEIRPYPLPFNLTLGMLKYRHLSLRDRKGIMSAGLKLIRWDKQAEKGLKLKTVEEWLNDNNQSEDAKQSFWYPIVIPMLNEMPHRASAVLFGRSFHEILTSGRIGLSILIPTVGQTELYVTGAEKFLRDRGSLILLNSEVTNILEKKSRVYGVRIKSGLEIKAEYVISSVPYYSLLGMIPQQYHGEYPFSILQEFQSSPIISIHLWFEKEFMDIDYVGLINQRLQWIFNRVRIINGRCNSYSYLTAILSAAYNNVAMKKEELISMAMNDIRNIFPESNSSKLIHSIVIKEKRATFSSTPFVESLRPSAENLLTNFILAGDWTQTNLPATIEGAIKSGVIASGLIKH